MLSIYAVCVPGTEDMTDAYHDYWFHIKGALIGMALGMPAALATESGI